MLSEYFTTIASALSPRYRVERLLQSGVAAYVYLADDRTLGRRVAIKILRDEMIATVNADRFLAEIRLATQLRHPNIVPVCDSGEVAGLPYFAMPFIDGETLHTRLERLGRLPLMETLRITEDVARALDFAHRHHVVHRDIKPENVLLDRGQALVLDFGIALALDAVEAPRHTLPGLTLGTVNYMSPEQVDGASPVDGRADVYSLACVVYEMLCGRPPFTGRANTVIRRHLAERPKPLADVCPSAPRKIGAALARALQKEPGDRYPTAGAFMTALLGGAPRVRVVGRCVAVVPFVNATDRAAVDAFSDAVSEEIAAQLREIEGIVVAPSAPVDPRDLDGHVTGVARRTGGDVVLFGDVRRSPDSDELTISGSLFDGRSGRRIWSGTATAHHGAELDGVSAAARNVARSIAAALGLTRSVECPNGYGLGARADSSCRNTSPSRRISAP